MTDEVAIRVQNISKRYALTHQASRGPGRFGYKRFSDVLINVAKTPLQRLRALRSLATDFQRRSMEDFWALKNVSFEVKRGEVIGIIGRNGAGKSTLLKILSRITEPTEGRIEIEGRMASLLEVGTGFHPELTGRENIFLNGAILGMSGAEVRRKFDEIVAFAEVEKFLDTPVKHFSSGMYVRLAFAVAAYLEPEILIVDEVLAVGDVAFQKKCLGKMGEVAKGGRTVLFVSHNMGVVGSLTQRCIYLQDGQIAASGNSRDIVETYLMKSVETHGARAKSIESYRRSQNSNEPVKITSIGIDGCGSQSDILPSIEIGSDFTIKIGFDVKTMIRGAMLDLSLKASHGERVAVLFSMDQGFTLFLTPGENTVTVKVSSLPLAPGHYFVDVGLNQSEHSTAYDVISDFPLFRVVNNGQVTHWLDRPWGVLHSKTLIWETKTPERG